MTRTIQFSKRSTIIWEDQRVIIVSKTEKIRETYHRSNLQFLQASEVLNRW